jgi:serine/threonine protein kinase
MWSVGCIFAELILKEPLFQAKTELELIGMIFKLLGPPTDNSWPEFTSLPGAKNLAIPSPQPHAFHQKFPHLTSASLDLMMDFLAYDPEMRITASEALEHPYFRYVGSHHLHFFDAHAFAERLQHQSIQTCSVPSLLLLPERSKLYVLMCFIRVADVQKGARNPIARLHPLAPPIISLSLISCSRYPRINTNIKYIYKENTQKNNHSKLSVRCIRIAPNLSLVRPKSPTLV